MMARILYVGAVALLLWLLYLAARRKSKPFLPAELLASGTVDELLPRHYQYQGQVRQALSREDDAFLASHLPKAAAHRVRRARRRVARRYLLGLREDYQRLNRLARAVAALAPHTGSVRESERMWLALRFQVTFCMLWVRLSVGGLPVGQLAALANHVGAMAARLEIAMAAWQTVVLESHAPNLRA